MHALLHSRTPTHRRIDELVGIVRDRQSAGTDVPDALGMYMLVDRAAGTSLGISIFEDEAAVRRGRAGLRDAWETRSPRTLRGKRLSVDAYEVAIHEVVGRRPRRARDAPSPAMPLRSRRASGTPSRRCCPSCERSTAGRASSSPSTARAGRRR